MPGADTVMESFVSANPEGPLHANVTPATDDDPIKPADDESQVMYCAVRGSTAGEMVSCDTVTETVSAQLLTVSVTISW